MCCQTWGVLHLCHSPHLMPGATSACHVIHDDSYVVMMSSQAREKHPVLIRGHSYVSLISSHLSIIKSSSQLKLHAFRPVIQVTCHLEIFIFAEMGRGSPEQRRAAGINFGLRIFGLKQTFKSSKLQLKAHVHTERQ